MDPVWVSQKVVQGVFAGVKTTELDNLAAETGAYLSTVHPDYGVLAARLSISNLQKQTSRSFVKTIEKEFHYISPRTGVLHFFFFFCLDVFIVSIEIRPTSTVDFARSLRHRSKTR